MKQPPSRPTRPSSPKGKPVSTKPQATAATSSTSPKGESGGAWFAFLFRPFNLLFAFVAVLFLVWLNGSVESYRWVYQSLLKDGYEYCGIVQKEIDRRTQGLHDDAQKRQMAWDTKYEAKVGVEFLVLKQIRDNTPPDAVILFPPPKVMTQKTSYLTLRYEITMKPWAAHFLYPRTIVYEQEKGKNPYFDKVQYVFVLHGWGFDYLDYEPRQRNAVDILPIHQPKNL